MKPDRTLVLRGVDPTRIVYIDELDKAIDAMFDQEFFDEQRDAKQVDLPGPGEEDVAT